MTERQFSGSVLPVGIKIIYKFHMKLEGKHRVYRSALVEIRCIGHVYAIFKDYFFIIFISTLLVATFNQRQRSPDGIK